jgi:signal transduction histidine kinase
MLITSTTFSRQRIKRLSALLICALASSLVKGGIFDQRVTLLRNQINSVHQEIVSLEKLSKAVRLAEFNEMAAVLARGRYVDEYFVDYYKAKESANLEIEFLSRTLDTRKLKAELNSRFTELDKTIQFLKLKRDKATLDNLTTNNRLLSMKRIVGHINQIEARSYYKQNILTQKLNRNLWLRYILWVLTLVFAASSFSYTAFLLLATRRERLKTLKTLQLKTSEQEEKLHQLQEESQKTHAETMARLQSSEDKEALKNVILSTFLHDSRTYLAIVRSSAEIMEEYEGKLNLQQKERHYGKIHRAVDSLLSLTDNSLLLLKDTDAKVNTYSLDLRLFCEEEIDKWCLLCKGTGRTFKFEQSGIERPVITSKMLLTRMFDNLVGNAIKYSDQEIVIRLDFTNPSQVVLSVIDAGPGIKQTELPGIFDTCIRGSNSGSASGFGIGLASVKRAAQVLELGLDVWSEEGVGSEFRIIFREPLTP